MLKLGRYWPWKTVSSHLKLTIFIEKVTWTPITFTLWTFLISWSSCFRNFYTKIPQLLQNHFPVNLTTFMVESVIFLPWIWLCDTFCVWIDFLDLLMWKQTFRKWILANDEQQTVILHNYSRLPIIRTFKGNRKKFELSGVRVIEGKTRNTYIAITLAKLGLVTALKLSPVGRG